MDKQSSVDSAAAAVPTKRKWGGLIATALPALFLLVDAAGKLVRPAPVVEATVGLGYPESVILPLGILLLACTIAYLVPQTAILGAVLLTGYLGGAVATHARIGSPVFTHLLFPVYLGVLVWLGLWLREPRLRRLLPIRTKMG